MLKDINTNTLYWKEPVLNISNLPLIDNKQGDCRLVKDTKQLFTWTSINPTGTLTDWISLNSVLNHNLLQNLDYENAGHTGFQKKLIYDNAYKCYLVSSI